MMNNTPVISNNLQTEDNLEDFDVDKYITENIIEFSNELENTVNDNVVGEILDSHFHEQPENYDVNNIINDNRTLIDIFSEEIVTSDQPIAEPADKSVKTRKRKAKHEDWGYGKWNYEIKRYAKTMKEPCNCKFKNEDNSKLKCGEFTNDQRHEVFKLYWDLDKNAKTQFVTNYTTVTATSRKRTLEIQSRRNSSIEYYLLANNKRIRICKTMFLNTLSISDKLVRNLVCNKNVISNNDIIDNDLDSVNFTNVIETNNVSERKGLLHAFLDSLSKMESHYCRSSSSKLYLEPNWLTKKSLYDFYCSDFCQLRNTKPMSSAAFDNLLEEKNISLFQPKKDACDICTAFQTGNLSIEEKEIHNQMKNVARQEKENDKLSINEVFTTDLQSVLLCPKSNVSSLYYKTKLIVHNFTIYDIKKKLGYCFLWNESEGGQSANEFTTIIVYFLQKFVIEVAKENNVNIILFSDGCTYQNRNSTLANGLLNLSILSGVTILQKFLQRGHTQMEVDSMHSTIEQKINYVSICKSAYTKSPYTVEYLSHDFFKPFTSLQYFKSIRPGNKKGDPVVTNIKALMYEPQKQINYKLGFSEDWSVLPLL
ncbi:Uncharacterized protein FWK35_00025276, partial [Aphis craccivora]